jgi:predicted dinucleotide-binding enzyme
MKIAFIGIGNVGYAIANNLSKSGHKIWVGSNDGMSKSIQKVRQSNPVFKITSPQEAINNAEIVFLATPFQANESVLKDLRFDGKTLVDCTNPVGPGLTHGLNNVKSGSEFVQDLATDAKVVKAFSIYGFENFIDCGFPEYNVKPAMLIAGNDAGAKKQASVLIEEMGYQVIDTGLLNQALHLEHMTLLWVKMARVGGHHPHFVWAYLEKLV